MRATAIVLLAALGGCDRPVPVMLATTNDAGPDPILDDRVLDTLDGAFNFWGLSWELVESGPLGNSGTVEILLVDGCPAGVDCSDGVFHGGLTRHEACEVRIWSSHDPVILAHELGHGWDLPHDNRPGNLMEEDAPPFELRDDEPWLDDDQWDDAQLRIDRFLACPGKGKR